MTQSNYLGWFIGLRISRLPNVVLQSSPMYFDQQNTTKAGREIEKGNQFSSNRLNFPGHTGEARLV